MATSKQLDKFYTNTELADALIDDTCEVLSLDRATQRFLEPSAGSGAFSSHLPHVLAYDIVPECEGIRQADFLTLSPEWDKDGTVAIGNPPFGKRARLAVAFVNKCLETCSAVGMVLPNTFRRYNTQKQVPEWANLVLDEDIPVDSFTIDGSPYSVRCCFQVWVDGRDGRWYDLPDIRTRQKPPISHPDFRCWQFNATPEARKYLYEPWELAFWRQGYKDYGDVMTRERDYDRVRSIMYETNLQLFLVQPLSDEAKRRILSLDLGELASRNLSTPGYGKADFVGFYEETIRREQAGKHHGQQVEQPTD